MSVAGLHSVPPAHVDVPAAHAPVASLHVSVPLHAMPSEHTRGVARHTVPMHVSPVVQKRPSSQLDPSFGVNVVVDTAGAHTSHWFDGLRCPAPKHDPPITHPVHVATHMSVARSQICPAAHVGSAATHIFVVSLHVSAPLHATPSSHRAGPAVHVPPVHTSSRVQKIPSSQLPPSFGLNAVVDVATWHR